MSCITIYHNPSCGTSRNTLAMIRQSGVEPHIVEYLQNPPSRAELKALLKGMCMHVREVLRQKIRPTKRLIWATLNGQRSNCSTLWSSTPSC